MLAAVRPQLNRARRQPYLQRTANAQVNGLVARGH